jgi:hypothetical protein
VVSGIASLVLSLRPDLSNDDLVQILKQCCDDLGAPGPDEYTGAGRINARRAVDLALSWPRP